jgi:hypothetical protein
MKSLRVGVADLSSKLNQGVNDHVLSIADARHVQLQRHMDEPRRAVVDWSRSAHLIDGEGIRAASSRASVTDDNSSNAAASLNQTSTTNLELGLADWTNLVRGVPRQLASSPAAVAERAPTEAQVRGNGLGLKQERSDWTRASRNNSSTEISWTDFISRTSSVNGLYDAARERGRSPSAGTKAECGCATEAATRAAKNSQTNKKCGCRDPSGDASDSKSAECDCSGNEKTDATKCHCQGPREAAAWGPERTRNVVRSGTGYALLNSEQLANTDFERREQSVTPLPANSLQFDWHGARIPTYAPTGGVASAVVDYRDLGIPLPCPFGFTSCGHHLGCKDLMTDRDNCGACGFGCFLTQSCIKGDCGCPFGENRCGDFCCGNKACDAAGTGCGIECVSPRTACGKFCVNKTFDPKNCGWCGNACGSDEMCCTGTCVKQDRYNCRSCGTTCEPPLVCHPDGCYGCVGNSTPCAWAAECCSGKCGVYELKDGHRPFGDAPRCLD